MPRVLIAGLGSIGQRHLRNLLRLGVKDVLLVRTSPQRLVEYPELPVFTDLDEALAEKPDVVLVTNPTTCHVSTALEAVRAGCHLFIEKPVSHSLEHLPSLRQLAKEKGVLVMMGFDLRFDPGLQKAKQLIEEGVIGRAVAIQAQVGQYLPDWHPHEDYRIGVSARRDTGGGVILDLIHELDYVQWLLGAVTDVACFAGHVSHLEIETEDVAAMSLRMACGAVGSVNLDYLQRSPSRTCRVIGEEGTILWDYFGKRVSWHKAGKDAWEEWTCPSFERNDRFVREMTHLLDCLEGTATVQADLDAGIAALQVALAAKRAAQERVICRVEQ